MKHCKHRTALTAIKKEEPQLIKDVTPTLNALEPKLQLALAWFAWFSDFDFDCRQGLEAKARRYGQIFFEYIH